MLWGCFLGTGRLVRIEGKMSTEILDENLKNIKFNSF
jgi:hypothetical protein